MAGHLAAHPLEALQWTADRFASQSPVRRSLPWFSWSAIRFLRGWLKPTHEVLELGPGGSTLFFAPRVARVLSIEHDAGWGRALAKILAERRRGNVDLRILAADESDAAALTASPYLRDIPPGRFDVIVVDGPERYPEMDLRPAAFDLARQRIKPGGIIVLDDSWRHVALLEAAEASGLRVIRLASVGPCRFGVTETAIVLA